jgi:membrane-bound ClpP family serine protease
MSFTSRSFGLVVVLWLSVSMVKGSAEKACLIQVGGAIDPARASYISRNIDEAKPQGAPCLIVQLNTPR